MKVKKGIGLVLSFIIIISLFGRVGGIKNIEAATGITTSMIDAVNNKYGYSSGRYWTYKNSNDANSYKASNTAAGVNGYKGYSYGGGVQCWAFARFLMTQVTGKAVGSGDWKKISAGSVSSLQIGDIVCNGDSVHTAVVYKDLGGGKYQFIQVYGGVGNKINVGPFSYYDAKGNSHSASTLSGLKSNGLQYIYRFGGSVTINNDPIGVVDGVEYVSSGKIKVLGWAFDEDNKSKSLDIHIYIGGSASDKSIIPAIIKADVYRKDVNDKYGISGNHGFVAEIDTSKTGDQDVYIYAINTEAGNNPLLGVKKVHIHDFSQYLGLIKPTCTEDGKVGYGCKKCSEENWKILPAYGHKWDSGTVTKAPTDTSTGEIKYTCLRSNCNETKVETIPVLEKKMGSFNNHDYIVCSGAYTATEVRKMIPEGYHLATITSSEENEYILGLMKSMTSVAEGFWLGANDVDSEGTFIWETGETFAYNRWPAGQPDNLSSFDSGSENYLGLWGENGGIGVWNDFPEEMKLGYILEKDEYSVCNHKWNSGVVTTEPTCTKKGIKTYTCIKCGKTYTEEIPMTSHNVVIDKAVAATTNTTGLTEGSHCSVCNKVIKAQTVIPKLDDNKASSEQKSDAGTKADQKTDAGTKAEQKSDGEARTDQKTDAGTKPEQKSDSGAKTEQQIDTDVSDSQNNTAKSEASNSEESKTNTNNESEKDNNKSIDGVPVVDGTIHGTIEEGLRVEKTDGSYVRNQWAMVNGNKYYFDAEGYAASNEYANGMWFDAIGRLDDNYSMIWKSNSTGYWIEDKSGWYPTSRWLKIDGKWYYFGADGYMASDEWVDGCWLSSSGAWEYEGVGTWKSNLSGWWFEDSSGWWATNCWQQIDCRWYYFGADGYMVTSRYIDGYWIDASGVCQ